MKILIAKLVTGVFSMFSDNAKLSSKLGAITVLASVVLLTIAAWVSSSACERFEEVEEYAACMEVNTKFIVSELGVRND